MNEGCEEFDSEFGGPDIDVERANKSCESVLNKLRDFWAWQVTASAQGNFKRAEELGKQQLEYLQRFYRTGEF